MVDGEGQQEDAGHGPVTLEPAGQNSPMEHAVGAPDPTGQTLQRGQRSVDSARTTTPACATHLPLGH